MKLTTKQIGAMRWLKEQAVKYYDGNLYRVRLTIPTHSPELLDEHQTSMPSFHSLIAKGLVLFTTDYNWRLTVDGVDWAKANL